MDESDAAQARRRDRPVAGGHHSRGDQQDDRGQGPPAPAIGRGRTRQRRPRRSPRRRDRPRGDRAIRALIVDAGALYGVADANDPDHAALVSTLQAWPGELVVSGFTAAEADHVVLTRLGIDGELALPAGLERARELCARYRDLEVGLADASIVVLADQWETNAIATFDQRHFRAIAPLRGGAFELFPTDALD